MLVNEVLGNEVLFNEVLVNEVLGTGLLLETVVCGGLEIQHVDYSYLARGSHPLIHVKID